MTRDDDGVPASLLKRIERLLHDATVADVTWDRALSLFTLRFNCLRRNPDGSDMDDRAVEFRLTGVRVIAVGYDSASLEMRPSRFEPHRRVTPGDLADWPFRPQEASLRIDSAAVVEDALDSARLDWLAGNGPDLRAAPRTFCLTFDQWTDFGMPVIHVRLLVGGDKFTVVDGGGVPFDVEVWEQQFEAWWSGWQRHWASKPDEEDEDGDDNAEGEGGGASEYETAIPAGEPEPPDPSYRPPPEPVFALEPTEAPPEVLRPVRDWFEGHHARDWARMARAYPHPEEPVEERAAKLEEWSCGHDFGRWGYARSVDDWWVDGRRACVIVRGVEHEMPSEGDPAGDREAVWTFALRHRVGGWVIDTYSQGWPGFGSAPKRRAAEKPWLKEWQSGTVR